MELEQKLNSSKNSRPPRIPTTRNRPIQTSKTGFSKSQPVFKKYGSHAQKKHTRVDVANTIYDSQVYYNRVMEIMQIQRTRPLDNDIEFWKKFVELTFDSRSRTRHCYSQCNDVQHSAPQPDPDTKAWPCWFCKSKSVPETVYQNLPSMYQSKFGSEGVIDDMLSLSSPNEPLRQSGVTIVDFGKAVIHRHFKGHQAIIEGSFRVAFTHDMKVLCWQFCTRSQEEFVSRTLLRPMVNNVVRCIEYSQGLDVEEDLKLKQEEQNYAMYHMYQNLRHLQYTMDQSYPETLHANNIQEQNMQKTESAERDLAKPDNSAVINID